MIAESRPDLPPGITDNIVVEFYAKLRSLRAVARRLGVRYRFVSEILRRRGVLANWGGGHVQDRGSYIPTQEEIRRGCEEIQARWTPEEKEKRLALGLRPVPWSLPEMNDMMKLCPAAPRSEPFNEGYY